MSKPLSDTIKARAAGLRPFDGQKIRKGGVGPEVWHGLAGTQRWGLPIPGSQGPAPGRDVRRAKGVPGPGALTEAKPRPVDRKNRKRV